MSRSEALLDARRNAVQQAVGFVSRGITEVIDGSVKEKIVILSRAFIEHSEITEDRREGARYTVGIKAWIHEENLTKGLVNYSPDRSFIDGNALYRQSISREKQIKEAADMLQECFNSIPAGNYIRSYVIDNNWSVRDGKLELDIYFSFDKNRYFATLASEFVTVLDYIAEVGMKDVPMSFEIGRDKEGNSIQIPPPPAAAFSAYEPLMEISKGNRYLETPGASGYANIYVMTRNYYFNCYHVPAESFAYLMESILKVGNHDRLTGGVLSEANLVITFRSKEGLAITDDHRRPLRLSNAMVFANVSGFKRKPYVLKNNGPLDEQNHSIFIMPFVGILTSDGTDYDLVENTVLKLQISVPPDQMRLIERIDCRIETN